MSHAENAEEKGRRVVLEVPEISHVSSTHHDDSSCATASQNVATETANPGRQREDPAERMSSPFGQALGRWHGKGERVPTLWSHHQRQWRDHRDQQVDPTAADDRRDTGSLQPECGWAHGVGLLHVEVQAAQAKVAETACRVGEAVWRRSRPHPLVENWTEETLVGRNQKNSVSVGEVE